MSNPAINAREVTVAFGRRKVLDGLTFTIEQGESVAITGSSGSGKTTLLSTLLGLLTPSSGSVHVLGTEVPRLRRGQRAEFRARHVGVVFQHGELLPELTAEENVALPALLSKTNDKDAFERARALLADLNVDPDTLTRVLSGGERQRVALARALINQPQIIFADEPTGSLDAELRNQAADLLFDIAKESGCTLVVVTHDPTVASRADRQLQLQDGVLQKAAA